LMPLIQTELFNELKSYQAREDHLVDLGTRLMDHVRIVDTDKSRLHTIIWVGVVVLVLVILVAVITSVGWGISEHSNERMSFNRLSDWLRFNRNNDTVPADDE
jgi:hypothetical protein